MLRVHRATLSSLLNQLVNGNGRKLQGQRQRTHPLLGTKRISDRNRNELELAATRHIHECAADTVCMRASLTGVYCKRL